MFLSYYMKIHSIWGSLLNGSEDCQFLKYCQTNIEERFEFIGSAGKRKPSLQNYKIIWVQK